jgi:uncharacterized protein (TIGR02172 family)
MTPTLSKPIAEGRTAEIYPWDDGHILKLYRDWCPADWVEYEARIARAVYAAGIPSPAAEEIVEVNGQRGLVYERLDGISMLQDMNARPWMILKHARTLAELHVKIHQQSIEGLPSYRERLEFDIRKVSLVSDEMREKVLARLKGLPEGSKLCHGDYHPGNVLITSRGPVVIDWMTACCGNPWTDVARTHMILNIGAKAAGKQVHLVIRMFIKLFSRTYLNRYLARVPDNNHELHRWLPIISAARLNENILPEREALLKIIHEGQ